MTAQSGMEYQKLMALIVLTTSAECDNGIDIAPIRERQDKKKKPGTGHD